MEKIRRRNINWRKKFEKNQKFRNFLQSKCFFFGPITSSVVALQTVFANWEPAKLCLAALIRSLIVCPPVVNGIGACNTLSTISILACSTLSTICIKTKFRQIFFYLFNTAHSYNFQNDKSCTQAQLNDSKGWFLKEKLSAFLNNVINFPNQSSRSFF